MTDFIAHLLDLFETFGDVSARRMFGGHGVFRHGLMFGLVADDTLYLKVDDRPRGRYEVLGLPAFIYEKKGKPVALGYHRVSEEALEDPSELRDWAEQAYSVALRAKR